MTNIPRWVREGSLLAVMAGVALHSAPALAVAGTDCTVAGCGANTPVLFGTPIIGLSTTGDVNAEGVVLEPTLERVHPATSVGCPPGTQLGIENGSLVGMRNGSVACRGVSMIGLAFWITVPIQPCGPRGTPQPSASGAPQAPPRAMRQPNQRAKPLSSSSYGVLPVSAAPPLPRCRPGAAGARVQIRIDESGTVSTWEIQNPEDVPTYRLVLNRLARPETFPMEMQTEFARLVNKSLCPMREAWMEQWQSDAIVDKETPVTRRESWRKSTDHLQVVQGETYASDGSIDPLRVGKKWFNFACVGTAIAKMRLLGYNPMAESPLPTAAAPLTTAQRARQATLKMLTARYNGDVSYTRPGIPLKWVRRDGTEFYGTPKESSPVVIESYWNERGAMCLSHRRTWRSTSMAGQRFVPLAEAMPEGAADDVASRWTLLRYVPGGFGQIEGRVVKAIQDRTGLIPCDAPPADYVWATYPVNHVAH